MEDFFSYLKGGAAVSAAPTKLLNTFYLIGALLALASGKAERRQVHPLKIVSVQSVYLRIQRIRSIRLIRC